MNQELVLLFLILGPSLEIVYVWDGLRKGIGFWRVGIGRILWIVGLGFWCTVRFPGRFWGIDLGIELC